MSELVSPVIWRSVLDDRYTSTVTRLTERQGTLRIMDGETTIYEHVVPLSAALYGPDADDVVDWAMTIFEVISERNRV